MSIHIRIYYSRSMIYIVVIYITKILDNCPIYFSIECKLWKLLLYCIDLHLLNSIIEYFYFYVLKLFITYEVFNYHIIILITGSLVWGNCSCVLHLAMNSHPSTSCAYRMRNVIHRERITCRTRRFICGKIKNKHRAGGS